MITNNDTLLWELGLACSVCILYIIGKVWVWYKVEQTNENERKDRK